MENVTTRNTSRFCTCNWKTSSVRKFVELAFKEVGIEIEWAGSGINEVGINRNNKKVVIKINKNYYRPTDVNILKGDFSRAKKRIRMGT